MRIPGFYREATLTGFEADLFTEEDIEFDHR